LVVGALESRKPTICFFRERLDKPETEPFAVIKAQKIILEATAKGFKGNIVDFFALMGDIDYVSSADGKKDSYVLCWFDDSIDDFSKAFRKLTGVTFPSGLTCETRERKRTYNVSFEAKHGKMH